MNLPVLAPGQKLAIGGGCLTLVGSVLPWIASANATVSGIEVDGFLAAMAAVSVLGLATLWDWRRLPMVGVTLFGAIITAIAANFLFTLEEVSGATGGAVGAGIGAYLVVIGGALVAGSGVYGLVDQYRAGRESAEKTAGEHADEPVENE